MKYVYRLLNIRAEEWRPIVYFWLFYATLCLMLQLGENLSMTLFIKRVGVQSLPELFIVTALVNMLASLGYTLLADRMSNRRIFILALLLSALGFGLAFGVASWWGMPGFWLFYVFRESSFSILIMHFGLYLRDFYSRADSERTFSVIYASGRLGGIVSGVLLLALSARVGVLHLTLLYPLLAVFCMVLLLRLETILPPQQKAALQGSGKTGSAIQQGWQHLSEGFRFVLRSKLLLTMSAATFLFVILRGFLNVGYSQVFNLSFATETQLAEFMGMYSTGALIVAWVIQLFLTSRLIQRIGVGWVNTLFSMAMALCFTGLLFGRGLWAGVLSRFVESELRMSLRNPVMNLFYNAVPDQMRARSRAFTFGLVLPLASLASGFILQGIREAHAVESATVLGCFLSVLFVWLSVQQAKAYQEERHEQHEA